MNWLRRLIPWAFTHDWKTNRSGKDMVRNAETGELRNFLICLRCSEISPFFDVSNREACLFQYHQRGCKGKRPCQTLKK